MTVLSVAAAAACALGGYVVRYVHERHLQSQRARVLRALGGQLPDWELEARKMEAEAARQFHGATELGAGRLVAEGYRQQADTIRRRGRKRDREWS